MRIIITLLILYACFAWLVVRWLRLASLPDRRFISKDIPDVTTLPEETSPPPTPLAAPSHGHSFGAPDTVGCGVSPESGRRYRQEATVVIRRMDGPEETP